jgi:hypothetical protein
MIHFTYLSYNPAQFSLKVYSHTVTSLISMISSFLGVYDMYNIADSGRAILWQLIMFMKHHKLRNLWYNCDGVLYFSLEKDYQSNGERRSHMIHAIVRPYKGRVWIGHIVQGLVLVVHYNISGWIYHLWNHQQLAIQGSLHMGKLYWTSVSECGTSLPAWLVILLCMSSAQSYVCTFEILSGWIDNRVASQK